jgi:hypothetical protein
MEEARQVRMEVSSLNCKFIVALEVQSNRMPVHGGMPCQIFVAFVNATAWSGNDFNETPVFWTEFYREWITRVQKKLRYIGLMFAKAGMKIW